MSSNALDNFNPYFNIRTPNRAIDYTNKDYEAFRTMMIKGLREFMPEYTDTSQTDAGIVIIEQLARTMDIISFHQDTYANEAFFLSSKDRGTAIRWARGLGYVPSNATAAVHEQVFVLQGRNSQDFLIPAGTKVKTIQSALEVEVTFETVHNHIIPAGNFGNETDEEGRYLYTVPVRQGITRNNERVGTSTGLSNQRFTLGQRNVIVDTLFLRVNEGGGFVAWSQVRTFIDSEKDSRHFMVEVDEYDNATIVFGDGLSGHIPSNNSLIVADYAVGGGVIGNVVPHSIKVMGTSIAGVTSTFNPYTEFIPGVEKESLAEIKRNAPAYLRSLWRAVTLHDHKDLALINFPQIKFANAIQDPTDRNNTWLFIMLKENAEISEYFQAELLHFFEQRKMIGNDVFIFAPKFKEITINADLWVEGDFIKEEVLDNVKFVINEYFKKGNYDFDTEFVYSDFEAMINSQINGVRSFRITNTDPIDRIIPAPEEILILAEEGLEIRTFGGIEQ